MYDHEVRWFTLLPMSILLGLTIVVLETQGVWGKLPVRPDFFWCLAFFAALKAPPVSSIFAFAWCGLMRDCFLGPKAGSASMAFVLLGWMMLYWKPLAALRGWLAHAVAAGSSACLVAFIKHSLDAGWMTTRLWEKIFFLGLGDGILTIAAYIPVALILSLPSFRPWRENSGYF